jgi:uncharacterized protein YjbJ (UPF0337 family)
MNWSELEGQWSQVTGSLKSQWGKLTDDDVKTVAGKKDVLLGKLQERYGILKEDAEKQADEWLAKFSPKEGKKS